MKQHTLLKKLLSILPPRQKANFLLILVMDAGHIVQRGTYAQLERTPGIFQDMALGKLR